LIFRLLIYYKIEQMQIVCMERKGNTMQEYHYLYRNIEYEINYKGFFTAYIFVPKVMINIYGKGYFDIHPEYLPDVHGGFTFFGDIRYNKKYGIGWDYAHMGDFMDTGGYYKVAPSKADKHEQIDSQGLLYWTIEEVKAQTEDAIDELIELNIPKGCPFKFDK
jgi:hypothetical protein